MVDVEEEGALKVEEFDCVGFGWTGPRVRRRMSWAGSWAGSRSGSLRFIP